MEEPIIKECDVPQTGSAEFFGRSVVVTRVEGRPSAFVAICPHLGGPLEVRDGRLVCAWHGAEFGLDGACMRGPARADSRAMVLPTRVIDGVVTFVYTPPTESPGAHEGDETIRARLREAPSAA